MLHHNKQKSKVIESYFAAYVNRIDRIILRAKKAGQTSVLLHKYCIQHGIKKHYESLGYKVEIKEQQEIWPNSGVVRDTIISWEE